MLLMKTVSTSLITPDFQNKQSHHYPSVSLQLLLLGGNTVDIGDSCEEEETGQTPISGKNRHGYTTNRK